MFAPMSFKPTTSFGRLILLLVIFSLAPITLYFLYARTGGPASSRELTFQRNMRFLLMADTPEIILPRITLDWEWEKVCVLDSKLTSAELNQIAGFDYELFGELHWMDHADYWTLFFVDQPREASWGTARHAVPIRISRKDVADLKLPDGVKGLCIPRENGRLPVTRHTAIVGVTPVTVDLSGKSEEHEEGAHDRDSPPQ